MLAWRRQGATGKDMGKSHLLLGRGGSGLEAAGPHSLTRLFCRRCAPTWACTTLTEDTSACVHSSNTWNWRVADWQHRADFSCMAKWLSYTYIRLPRWLSGWTIWDAGDAEDVGWSLGGEVPLEEGMAAHSSVLPGKSHGQRSLADSSPWVTVSHDWSHWAQHTHTQAVPVPRWSLL